MPSAYLKPISDLLVLKDIHNESKSIATDEMPRNKAKSMHRSYRPTIKEVKPVDAWLIQSSSSYLFIRILNN